MALVTDIPGFFALQQVLLENRLLVTRIEKLEEQMDYLMVRHHEAKSRSIPLAPYNDE